jgi:type IX secretion system PorP/SprF family membrane protein
LDKYLFAIVIFSIGLGRLFSQDVHFSQYKEASVLLNPALTGNTRGDWRVGIHYREQWTKVATTYQTFNITFDEKLFVYSKVFMVGGYVLADQVNSKGLTRYTISPSLAYRFDIENNRVKIGIQPGIGFYSLNKNVTYPDQFNYETGLFDNTLPTRDLPFNSTKAYADIALGVLWSRNLNGIQPNVGVSFYHINRPNTSIYQNQKKIRLPVKSLMSVEVPYQFTSTLHVSPGLL